MELSKKDIITNKKTEYKYNQKLISVNSLKKEETNENYNFLISVYENNYVKLILNFLDETGCHYKTEKANDNYHQIYVRISLKKEKFLFYLKIRTLINQYST